MPILVLTKSISCEGDLQQQNQNDYLNPLNDYEQEQQAKEQDKRTVFSNHHGWAKHVGVHPAGFKYVLGYGPVELKYVPVVKPISIKPHLHHHHHHRIKLLHVKHPHYVRPLLPVRPVIHHDGWRPVVPIVKPVVKPVIPVAQPVVPVNVPLPQVPHKPWQNGWNPKPVHVHPAPVTVIKPVLPVKPIVPVKPVHTIVAVKPVQPLVPIQPIVPIKPVHHVPVPIIPSKPFIPVAQPVAPLLPVAPVVKPFPPPVSTTVFHQIPAAPGVFFHNPALFPHHHHHHHHHVVPVNQVPVDAPPPVVVPQTPAQTIVPVHIHPHQTPHIHPQLPQPPHEQHDVQTPLIPQDHSIFQQQLPGHLQHLFHQLPQHPHIYEQQLPQPQHPENFQHVPQPQHPEIFQQQLPHEHVPVQHPEVFHQQLPQDANVAFHQHPQQVPVDQQLPENAPVLFHQQLPGNVQHHFNQQIRHGDGASSNILLQGSIQPGHTDLQIPYHLPQHPNYLPEQGRQFQPGNFHDPSQHPDVVRPSISLEPPFTHQK